MISITDIIYTSMISFLMVIIMGPLMIPVLHKLKFGQTVRNDGPKTHLIKNGTPTMGGIMMILAIMLTVLIRSRLNSDVLVALLCVFGFGFIGFVDDFIIIKKKRSLGLNAKQKMVLQILLAGFIAYYRYNSSVSASQFIIPFTDYVLSIGFMYIPVMIVVIVGTVNAVNLTDGLDGLASGITAIVSVFFIIFAREGINNPDVVQLAAATLGACIGFLGFNSYPAKIFMGDTGSMALGGAVAAFAIFTNSALIIPIVGGIYFAEALSVMIQVTYFKRTGKRVFKMAPLHHHYEQLGWPETRVVFVFWITSIFLAWIGIIAVF